MITACSAARRPLARRISRNDGRGGVRAGEQGAEVGVGADEHPVLRAGFVDDDSVGRAAQADVTYMHHIVAGGAEEFGQLGGEVVIEQEPHAEWRSGSSRSRTASAA